MRLRLLSLTVLLGAAQVLAQPLRDPTSWPAGVQAPVSASSSASGADGVGGVEGAQTGPKIQQIVIVDGHAYVVSGGRRYGVGARFGEARITRIEDQAVWLRDASGTHREALYPGIEKRVPATAAAPAVPAAAKNKPTRVGPRATAQEKS